MSLTAEELGIDIDLSREGLGRGVPHEAFAVLRERAPVWWYEPEQYWVVSTYELVGRLNQDPETFSSLGGVSPDNPRSSDLALTMLNMDPPQHTVHRRMASVSFKPSAVRRQEGTARHLASELVNEFVDAGGGDFIEQVAAILPVRMICEMLGIDREREEEVLNAYALSIGPTDPASIAERSERQIAFAVEVLDDHRRHPRGGDVVDDLLNARVDGEPLTQEQLRAYVNLYINGGSDTTRHLIGLGMLALLEWPDERRKLAQGADLATAVEEMLRFTPSVMQHSRWPVRDVEVEGQRIKRWQRTTLWMVSANRDETVFPDPDRFDVTRTPNRHDSFGAGGPHFCIGAGVARLEARSLFEELRPHLERLELAGRPERIAHTMFNGLAHLPLSVS